MQDLYDNIIKWLLPFILTSIVTFIGKIIKELKNVKKANEVEHKSVHNGILAILRSEIVSYSEYYITLGYLPDHARITLSELMDNYKKLGGNHGIEQLVDQCFQLPPINVKVLNEKE